MPRPTVPDAEKVKNAGICLAPREIAAVQAIAIAHRFRSTGDLLRHALAKYPRGRGKFRVPNKVKSCPLVSKVENGGGHSLTPLAKNSGA